jgi:transketolase
MNSIAKNLPWLIGGSADLETSNKTRSRLKYTRF